MQTRNSAEDLCSEPVVAEPLGSGFSSQDPGGHSLLESGELTDLTQLPSAPHVMETGPAQTVMESCPCAPHSCEALRRGGNEEALRSIL